MNWLDLVLAAIIGLSVATGFMKGFFRLSIGLAATVLSILLACWFYGIPAGFFAHYLKEQSLANFLGFLSILLGVQLVGALLARLLSKSVKKVGMGWLDRLLGGAFGAVRAILIATVFVMILTAFSGPKAPESVAESKIAPYVLEAAQILVYLTPREIRDGFHSNYEKLREQWNHTIQDTIKKTPAIFKQ